MKAFIWISAVAILLAACDVQALTLEPGVRKVFVWNEPESRLTVRVVNPDTVPVELPAFTIAGENWQEPLIPDSGLPLAPGETRELHFPFAVRLAPGSYALKLAAGEEIMELPIEVVALPYDAMPVVSWSQSDDFATLAAYGFTHTLRYQYAYAERHDVPGGIRVLDETLRLGIRILDNFSLTIDDLPRLRRNGESVPYSVDTANPEAQRRARQYFTASVQVFGHHPAYAGALVNSELRDHTVPSWSGFEEEAFEQFAGYPIPEGVNGKTAPDYRNIAGFPRSRILPDNDPLLVYYRWFWEQGDGWMGLNSATAELLRDNGAANVWSFHDPAVRCPPKWGSGGSVDYLNQWSYCYPDPIKIAQSTDELLAMAAGRPGQQVMKMTQAIWYRDQSAPAGQSVTAPPEWAGAYPGTEFITIAPDQLKEAFWSKVSRPIAGIMYHGYGSLFGGSGEKGYTMTNAASREVLKELVETVIQPLGPVLKHLPARASEVVILESFASTIFAGRGTWGWGRGWIADTHLMCQWAGLQPGIVYEESILRGDLAGVKVLILPHCDVLPQSVFNAIRDFQRGGGIVVGDEFTVPALLPNLRLASYERTGKAETDKVALQQLAAQFKRDIAPFHTPYATGDNPDIITYARNAGNADYIFAVNDKRSFGDYVGMYGLVQEQGVPNRGTVTVRRAAAAVYDPVRHQSLPFEVKDGTTVIPVEFTTSDGKLLLLTDAAVASVIVDATAASEGVAVSAIVADAEGNPIAADFPLAVTVTDADGTRLPVSGYYRAPGGKWEFFIPAFYQGAPFPWELKVQDLASGTQSIHHVTGAQ